MCDIYKDINYYIINSYKPIKKRQAIQRWAKDMLRLI